MTTPIPEVVARLAKYEAAHHPGLSHWDGIYEAYGEGTGVAHALFLADLRALLAEHASLTAERDRLAAALKAARGWVVTCSAATHARRDLARIDAALSQPERREVSGDG